MKTFDEYINESRQNYIFGGTDNRAPEITKTFAELEVGDYILYFSSRTLKTPIRIRIDDIKVFSNRVECKCKFDKDYDAAFTIYSTDSQYYESKEYPGYYFKAYGTNEELFIETLKEDHDLNFSVSDIEDRVDESRQNYIFGGTDNRAPKTEKTFAELEQGDDVFYAYINKDKTVHIMRKYVCYETKYDEKRGELLIWYFTNGRKSATIFDINKNYIDSPIYISKLRGYRSGMTAIVSTDADTLLEEVNRIAKKNFNYTVDDFIVIKK